MNSIIADIRSGLVLLPAKMDTIEARAMLVAINLQENPQRLEQQTGGPARGDYQMERGGGVHGVLNHSAVKDLAAAACKSCGVSATEEAVYQAIGKDRVLAAALARLLLWADSNAMPALGDAEAAWTLYLSAWRPGAAKRDYDNLHQKFITGYGRAVNLAQAS